MFSIVLGIVAICLSIVFFLMADKTSKESEKSAIRIDSSVKKLELLFEKLYSGTFVMMKETVTYMRKDVYGTMNIPEQSNNKINKEIYEKTLAEVAVTIEEIKSSQKSETELQDLIMNIIQNSKQAEKNVKNDLIIDEICSFLIVKGGCTYNILHQYLTNKGLAEALDSSIFNALKKLADNSVTNNPFVFDNEI
ncbi:hypothetical protein [Clostridium sp.]|uniref:hypothetical protein n=1 Tax=Clostridium sp. TaxID=1506 RepID=UPI003F4BB47E